MRITDLLDKRSIQLAAAPADKEHALKQAVALMEASGKLSDVAAYQKQVFAREEESTTGIGEGIAIPHGKCEAVKKPGLAAMVIPNGVDFDSLDGEPVTLLFLIAAPNTKDNVHLDVLSKLSVMLMDEEFTAKLRNAQSVEEFLQIIDEADSEKAGIDERLHTEPTVQSKILAVTSCPTGIAHTYMAAEGLEKAAQKAGCAIKIETRGSGGAKNVLTQQEIDEADCIIVAADAKVPMERFDGKHVIECQVSDGISKADELIERALKKDAPIYKADTKEETTQRKGNSDSVAHRIYMQLMNGVSHMLPFVIGGGILIALAFLVDNQAINPANFGKNTPLAALLKTIGEQAFGFMLPILAGFIAMSIADRPGLAIGFVGGALANGGYTFANIMAYDSAKAVSSGFIGALFAGFVGGYIMVLLRKLFDKLPSALEGLKPILLFPVCGILIMGVVMIAVNPVVGAINTGLNNFLSSMSGTSSILLGAVLGAMMSIDMGGPFNKAAYVFGTAQLTVANAGPEQYAIMAAVMAGGMVPPLAIALCTTFFKNRFTESERKSGVVNYIMGLSFITEGAIPFAAGDPIHILPPCIVGSAVAGALSMAFKCGLPAPHGGIFVIGVITNPVQYLISVVVGAVIGMIVMSFTKKPLNK